MHRNDRIHGDNSQSWHLSRNSHRENVAIIICSEPYLILVGLDECYYSQSGPKIRPAVFFSFIADNNFKVTLLSMFWDQPCGTRLTPAYATQVSLTHSTLKWLRRQGELLGNAIVLQEKTQLLDA